MKASLMSAKTLPKDLTSYDLLKAEAVIIMIVDHIGFYFYPDQLWYRAVGRIGFPIWFFLVGYAQSRDISPKLVGGALILLVANMFAGMSIFPMNALVTIMLMRLALDGIMKDALRNLNSLVVIS